MNASIASLCRALTWAWLIVCFSAPAFGAAQDPGTLGAPLPGLEPWQRRAFVGGKVAFERNRRLDTGFGPLFNGVRCAQCHRVPVVGGHGAPYNNILHAGVLSSNGFFRSARGRATSIIHTWALQGELETIPPEANAFSQRQVRPLFGLGLIEAIPDAQILAGADPTDRDGDGISGRPVYAQGRVRRFGSQNQMVSLRGFVEGAFREELGFAAGEIDPAEVDRVLAFVRFLRPPARGPITPAVVAGERIFARIGCADCHTPSFEVPVGSFVTADGERVNVRALQGLEVSPYSDFLLHDMGPELDDGVGLRSARRYEYRTAPLWGLRFRNRLLHDGRAPLLNTAIRLHGGEAAAAREAFLTLPVAEQKLLKMFLSSL